MGLSSLNEERATKNIKLGGTGIIDHTQLQTEFLKYTARCQTEMMIANTLGWTLFASCFGKNRMIDQIQSCLINKAFSKFLMGKSFVAVKDCEVRMF